MNQPDVQCGAVLAALARGDDTIDWDDVELHLVTCAACTAGLTRFSAAIDEQFAASDALAALGDEIPGQTVGAITEPAPLAPLIAFPNAGARERRRRVLPRLLVAVGMAAAAVVVLGAVFVLRAGKSTPVGETTSAEFRPEFVQSISVLPERPNHTYVQGELVTISIVTLQPERIVLSVIEGHNTFMLFDTNADPGVHPLPPYRIVALRGRATLRLEAYYGPERVAREDVTLLPAEATPVP